MFMQGTWADHIVIQAVADSFNLNINIVESNEQFSEIIVIQAMNTVVQNVRSVYLGHIGEMHYVSTLPALTEENNNHTQNDILD